MAEKVHEVLNQWLPGFSDAVQLLDPRSVGFLAELRDVEVPTMRDTVNAVRGLQLFSRELAGVGCWWRGSGHRKSWRTEKSLQADRSEILRKPAASLRRNLRQIKRQVTQVLCSDTRTEARRSLRVADRAVTSATTTLHDKFSPFDEAAPSREQILQRLTVWRSFLFRDFCSSAWLSPYGQRYRLLLHPKTGLVLFWCNKSGNFWTVGYRYSGAHVLRGFQGSVENPKLQLRCAVDPLGEGVLYLSHSTEIGFSETTVLGVAVAALQRTLSATSCPVSFRSSRSGCYTAGIGDFTEETF